MRSVEGHIEIVVDTSLKIAESRGRRLSLPQHAPADHANGSDGDRIVLPKTITGHVGVLVHA